MAEMRRQKVQETLIKDASYESLASVIEELAANGVTPEQYSEVRIERREEYSYGDTYHYITLYRYRDETDEEMNAREKKMEDDRIAREERDRQRYEELKAKFEG